MLLPRRHGTFTRTSVGTVLALVLVFAAVPASAGLSDFCTRLAWVFGLRSTAGDPVTSHDGTVLDYGSDGFAVTANKVLVTGPWDYPTDVITHGLGMTLSEAKALKGRVLSLGEGYSGLLPELAAAGVDIHGLDLWYGNTRYPSTYVGGEMRRFYERHRARLIRGDATAMPVADGSYDHVISHALVNNLTADRQREVLQETVRVLAAGGEGRLYGFSRDRAEEAKRYLEGIHGDTLEVSYEQKWSQWFHPYVGRTEIRDYLLVIRKKRPAP